MTLVGRCYESLGDYAVDIARHVMYLAGSAPRQLSPLSGHGSGARRPHLANLYGPPFARRPVVLLHGDFAPVDVLTDGTTVTGLLDFEAARLAGPLIDPAWWAWPVSLSGPGVLETAWPAFPAGADIDPAERGLRERVRVLQALRLMEQLATGNLTPGIASIVTHRLRAALTLTGPHPGRQTGLSRRHGRADPTSFCTSSPMCL